MKEIALPKNFNLDMKPEGPKVDLTEQLALEAAISLKKIFDAWIKAGFTEQQAISLLSGMLNKK